jgi:hypothetical protein
MLPRISRLRQKLHGPGESVILQTVPSMGHIQPIPNADDPTPAGLGELAGAQLGDTIGDVYRTEIAIFECCLLITIQENVSVISGKIRTYDAIYCSTVLTEGKAIYLLMNVILNFAILFW